MFKVGDTVKCVDVENSKYLVLGKIYKVLRIGLIGIFINGGMEGTDYMSTRFVKYDPIKGTCNACNSSCKQDKPCGLYSESV